MIVPEWRFKKALKNDKIRGCLSHSKLKAIIRDIDSAVSHKKKPMLRRRMKIDIDFKVFIDDLLKEMGYMNEEGVFEAKKEDTN